jgi:glucose-6-phosphate 1-dehydrogenase
MSKDQQGPRPADAFVAFGISGDLARKMTFVSLYQLERRGMLNCPILGVAAEDWTDEDLRIVLPSRSPQRSGRRKSTRVR